MRTRLFVMAAALMMASPAAHAQDAQGASQPTSPAPLTPAPGSTEFGILNRIDFGLRTTSFGSASDEGRFQRYRDLRDGGTVDLFSFDKRSDNSLFDVHADHLGYRDQRITAAYNNYGRIKASFEWNQIPLFYSDAVASLYTDQGSGQLRIANTSVRTGIQGGSLPLTSVGGLLGSTFDMRQRRDIAAFNLVGALGKDLDLRVNLRSTHKDGYMPWGASFGFSADNEVAAPIDHRTTDLGAALEWAGAKGMARIGYDGSWFVNAIPTLTYDSPYRTIDSTNASAYVAGNGTSQGRTAMWPDSTANTISAAGAYNLPAHSRVNGVVSIGDWRQNAALLPYTINSAIPAIPLDRQTADADARITSFNVNFTSRPTGLLWLNVRARRYDYDNRTPEFHVTNYVRLDQVIEPSTLGHSEPFGYTRDYFDADASFTPMPYTALKIGYGMEKVNRTFRYLDETTEHTVRTALDTTGSQYVTFRVAYEHSKRVGKGLDEEALDDIGEQVSLRQYDISNRDRDRVTALVQVTPISQVALIASVQTGRDTRPDADFGLRKFDTNAYSFGFDISPIEKVDVGLTYSYDDVATNQKSRQANPGSQFADPTRDWFTDMSEKVHYVVASVDLTKAIPRTDVHIALDWNKSNADYIYSLPANTTLAAPAPLPTVYNELRRATVDFKYFLTRHVAAGFVYLFDEYKVDDFALSPNYAIGQRTLPDGLMLGYGLYPYRANTGWVRLTYFW
jgi:MtrB/PioB family decaheme-associated outer membrane protein